MNCMAANCQLLILVQQCLCTYFRNFSWCSTSDTSSEKEIQEVPDHMKMISMTSPFAVWTQVLLRAAAGFFDRGPDVHIHGGCSCSKKYFRATWCGSFSK